MFTLGLWISFLYIINCNPIWPNIFYSEWNWYQAFPDGKGKEGPCIWAYNGDRMYLNITADNNEQLIIDNKFYNLYPLQQTCTVIEAEYNLIQNWFSNTSLIGYDINNAIYMGQLLFSGNIPSNFMVYVNRFNNEFGSKYVAINIYRDEQNRPGSEVNDVLFMNYSLPNNSQEWFQLPNYCNL